MPECAFYGVVIGANVISNAPYSGNLDKNLTDSTIKEILGSAMSLGDSEVSVSAPWGYKSGELATLFIKGYGVVTVDSIDNRFPGVLWYTTCCMEG